jgi:hypothetical protein
LAQWSSTFRACTILPLAKIDSMTILTTEQIAEFRDQLASYPDALKALEVIADCEGDLEDAAMVIAIRVGQQPDTANSLWLDGLAKKCRAVICQQEFRNDMVNGSFAAIVEALINTKICHPLLVTPVLLYVFQQGVNKFCQSLDEVIENLSEK